MTDEKRGRGPLSPRYDQALAFAADVHREQRRKGTNIAYLSHLMTVSSLVLEDDGSEDEAIAGLLHDAVEDGPPGVKDQIEQRFGSGVLELVLACTDDEPGAAGKRPWVERKEGYVAHLSDAPLGALKVTAADKLHNLRCTHDDLSEQARAGVVPSWPKSNGCVHQNLWYYAGVTQAVRDRVPTSRTAHGLDRVLDEVCELISVARPTPSTTVPSCEVCAHAAV